jgi:hypothetical protein
MYSPFQTLYIITNSLVDIETVYGLDDQEGREFESL